MGTWKCTPYYPPFGGGGGAGVGVGVGVGVVLWFFFEHVSCLLDSQRLASCACLFIPGCINLVS